MSDTQSYLFKGEEVVLIVRPHPVVMVKSALAPLAAIALLAAIPGRFTLIALLVVFLRFFWDAGMWWADRYVLTTERIISMAGIFTKKVVSLPLSKITDLTYARSLLGRILGYGSLDLESAGQKDFGKIDFLPEPDHFYRAVMALALGPRPVISTEPESDELPAEQEILKPTDFPLPKILTSKFNPDHDVNNTDEIPVIWKSED